MLSHLSGLQALAYLSTGYFKLTGGVLARHTLPLSDRTAVWVGRIWNFCHARASPT
jgi:hypothetical protein